MTAILPANTLVSLSFRKWVLQYQMSIIKTFQLSSIDENSIVHDEVTFVNNTRHLVSMVFTKRPYLQIATTSHPDSWRLYLSNRNKTLKSISMIGPMGQHWPFVLVRDFFSSLACLSHVTEIVQQEKP